MRTKIVAGNWKMNKDHIEAAELARGIADGITGGISCDVIVFPPFTALPAVIDILRDTEIETGGQNIYFEDQGAYTGEISAGMLNSLGCRFVLAGHSERRHIFGEGSEIISKKIRAAFRNGLSPVLCVGELLEERNKGMAEEVVEKQLREALEGISVVEMDKLILAYEPVWAIGTGETATPFDARDMHSFIRNVIGRTFDTDTAERVRIMYGGSVKPENSVELLSIEDIDGALVGGASLDPGSFIKIIESAP